MHTSSAALRFFLLWGAVTKFAGRIVAKRDVPVSAKVSVQLNILEASHLAAYDVSGCRFSELLVCLPHLENAENGAAATAEHVAKTSLKAGVNFDGLIDSFEVGDRPYRGRTQEAITRRYDLGGIGYEVRIWRAPLDDPEFMTLLGRVSAKKQEVTLLHKFAHDNVDATLQNQRDIKELPLTALYFHGATDTLQSAHSYPDEGCVVLTKSHVTLNGKRETRRR